MDVLSAYIDRGEIGWYENTGGKGTFGPQKVITNAAVGVSSVYATDVDGDGDVDVLSASEADDNIAWYENTDGKGSFGPQKVITTAADGARSVYAADVDGDGDMDVLSASAMDDRIAWYENRDGNGTFGPQRTITDEADMAISVYAADMDGDGDVDVVSASNSSRFSAVGPVTFYPQIYWYENSDGKGNFGPPRAITNEAKSAWWVYAADVDGDGDMDVLSASAYRSNIVGWYENIDGKGRFGPQRIITDAADESVFAVDLDGDGDLDVLSASFSQLAWYENTDGRGSFSQKKQITEEPGERDFDFLAYRTDVDGDGDEDETRGVVHDAEIYWRENIDGNETFGQLRPLITLPLSGNDGSANSVYATDMDGDGDVDIVSASATRFGAPNEVTLYEQRPQALAGDANRDGAFDQLDIVQVLGRGAYLTGQPATFEEGDWNGDGVFDQRDIVAALQTGTYLHEAAVDEAMR